ncbi:hypothetical protein BGZ72_001138, partial [Mortierella alpina]
ADAFNFGQIIRTVAAAVDGCSKMIHSFSESFTAEELGFSPDADYKARLLAVNALCQLESRKGLDESEKMCNQFGQRYYKNDVGRWGCGSLRKEEEKGYFCTFEPTVAYTASGVKVPDIVLRRDQWREKGRSSGQTPCSSEKPIVSEEYEMAPAVDDEIEPSFKSSSHFFASALLSEVEQHASAYEDTQSDRGLEANSFATMAIVKALGVAGIRYPIGLRVCQLCKGTCNKIMPKSMLDTCKHQVCVGLLGGVKVTQGTEPSCSEISQP